MKTHFADDETLKHIAQLERECEEAKEMLRRCQSTCERLASENAELRRDAERYREIALDWGQGVTDAETAIRQLHNLFPIAAFTALEPEHIETDRCGFDRNASHSEGRYVCMCESTLASFKDKP